MKKTFTLLCLTSMCYSVMAQSNVPNWENPKVYAINKEATRATSIPYADESTAVTDNAHQSPYYRSLDGLWKFHWVPKVEQISPDFHKEGFNDASWTSMPVPGNWEFNGFGIPMYVNTGFGFEAKPPFVNRDDSPVGMYRQPFDVPADWDGRRVFLHFEGGTNAMFLWINGQQVGYTQNSKSPAEFDITKYLRKGKNLLACQVHKFSDGSYLEDQDMWRLGGINRSVYMYSTAQTRILDFFAHPDLDSNYKNGVFSVDVDVKNYAADAETQEIAVTLLDNKGKKVFSKSQKVTVEGNNIAKVNLAGTLPSVARWTAETPNLYTMVISLKNADNKHIESVSHRIGFRKIEIKNGQVLVNGKKVLFKGVNLHEFNVNTGQVVTIEEMKRNLQLMRELNINAVRTSHYPQPPLWYKLCDEYGIYLVDEANLESHGLGYGPDNVANFPEWHGAHMDRIVRLVERDKNHASVIFWSLGNEASNGTAFFDMYDWAKLRDTSRPVQYEQAGRGRNTDVICPMYPSWSGMQKDAAVDLGRPYIMCEYAHAMGNSMGNFQEYWDLMRSSKNMQGGFIWEWYNHGYKAQDEQGRNYWAYGGDLEGHNNMNQGNFCIDGIVSPDQEYLPHTYIVKKVYQDILFEAKDLSKGIVTVINDYKFTDLNPRNYTYKWVLLRNGEAVAQSTFDATIPADSRKDMKLDLPSMNSEAGVEYHLQLYAYRKAATEFTPAGFEVAKGEFAFAGNNYFAQTSDTSIVLSTTLSTNKKDNSLVVNAGATSYEFSLKDGSGLLAVKSDGKNVFRELPRLNFWRAPTDNDFGEWTQYSLRLWDGAGHNTIWKYNGHNEATDKVVFNYTVKLRAIEAKVDIAYTVNKDGTLTTDAHYQALSDELPEMVRFGMIMTLPKTVNHFAWYGRGPHENYIDRNTDTFMGIWSGKVKDQAHPYIRPQETGNKTDVRWLTLTDKNGAGIRVTGSQPLSATAINNKPEDLDPGMTKKQQHASDVDPLNETVLYIDLFQRGLAGLNSWGAKPLDEYRFRGKEYRYNYTIQIIE